MTLNKKQISVFWLGATVLVVCIFLYFQEIARLDKEIQFNQRVINRDPSLLLQDKELAQYSGFKRQKLEEFNQLVIYEAQTKVDSGQKRQGFLASLLKLATLVLISFTAWGVYLTRK